MTTATATPIVQLSELHEFAAAHGLHLVPCDTPYGTDYVVYRRMPVGMTRLGKRSTLPGVRRAMRKWAGVQ